MDERRRRSTEGRKQTLFVSIYESEGLVERYLCSGDRSAPKSQHHERERKQVQLKEGDEKDGCSGGGGGEAKEGPGGVKEVRFNRSQSVGVCLSAPL